MIDILVDSNVLIDIFTEDWEWFEWSSQKIAYYLDTADEYQLIIRGIVDGEGEGG